MAGFFGRSNYAKPGPGVSKGGMEKKRFFLFFEIFGRKLSSMIPLNIVYVLCCIPIITIGPMTAGLTYVLRNFANETPGFPMSDMFEKAWENKWQALGYFLFSWFLRIAALFALYFYIFLMPEKNTVSYVAIGLSFLCYLILTMMAYYGYLQIVTLRLTLRGVIKNSFIFAVLGLKTNFITFLVTHGILFLLVWFVPEMITILGLFLIGASAYGFVVCFNSFQYIQKHVIDRYEELQREAQAEEKPQDEDDDEDIEAVFSDEFND